MLSLQRKLAVSTTAAEEKMKINISLKLSAWFVLVFLLTSCGGGSSNPAASSPVPTPMAGPTTATVGIILTDAAVDDYDHAYVTITSVELIGDGGHQLIFSGEETVDLLALRDSVRLFAVSEDVEPDAISKIRLKATGMQLVQDNGAGPVTTDVDLVANGKIDLNLRESIDLAAGDVVFVSLDWDMNESLKFTTTGTGRKIMRPVIFAVIDTEPAFKQGLVRVSGEVELVAADSTAFRMCSPDVVTQLPNSPVLGSLCLDVVLNEKTGLFGPDGMPIAREEIVKGAPVTVLGLLQRSMDGVMVTLMDDSGAEVAPSIFQVLALVVEGGEPGTWQQLLGTVQTVVDADSKFDFLLDNGQGFADDSTLTGQLFPLTRVFKLAPETGITEITGADLAEMDRAAMDSVVIPSGDAAVADVLNIAIMLARTPGDDEPQYIKGSILSTDSAAGELRIATAGGDRCVTTDMDTAIFEVFVHADSVESMPATLDDLDVGANAVVTGAEGDCFAADLIIAEGQTAAP